jgi:sporulation protein YlmC with PRC-barrel domain
MRTFSSLQGRKVETVSGRSLGRCHDLRGELTGSELRVTGICVGTKARLAHLGLRAHDEQTIVPWERVVRIEGERIVVRDN